MTTKSNCMFLFYHMSQYTVSVLNAEAISSLSWLAVQFCASEPGCQEQKSKPSKKNQPVLCNLYSPPAYIFLEDALFHQRLQETRRQSSGSGENFYSVFIFYRSLNIFVV